MITKEIWDISAVAAVVNPRWMEMETVHSPILTEKLTFNEDARRHFIRAAYSLNRDAIYKDMYAKISASA
jgi:hypothetical protein